MNFYELVEYVKTFDGDKEKLYALSHFIIDNVSYNYEVLSHSKVCKYLKNNDPDSIVDFRDKAEALQFIFNLSKKLGLSEKYLNNMLGMYNNLKNTDEIEFMNIVPILSKTVEYEDEVLKKGVCEQISQFFKKVCDEVGISCKVIHGNTGFAHAWNIARVDNADLHYDCTYAMYSKDGYAGFDKKTVPNDWIGISETELRTLNPSRKFDPIKM